MTYNQQTNNQFNDCRTLHASSSKTIFNGPIHGYIQHVTGEGPVIAYSEVTYVNKFSKTTVRSEHTASSFTTSASPSSRFPIKHTSENNRGKVAVPDGSALISPSIPLPIDRRVLETEFSQVSPEMQRYIKYLLRQYESSYTESQTNGQAGEIDQR